MGGNAEASGPDFTRGVGVDQLPADGTLSGRVGDEAVLVSRFGDEYFAVGGACTHYGAALSGGLCDGATVRCPLHHACFSLKTGAALSAPALDDLDRWQVVIADGSVFVTRKIELTPSGKQSRAGEVERIVIVGGGAAGLACAHRLRKLGYSGAVSMLSADSDPPVDRPNLSKDFLAGTAPADWMPLRPKEWYRDNQIALELDCEVAQVDTAKRLVRSSRGDAYAYDRLLIATGSEPNRLRESGFNQDNVFTLRSFADARAIAAQAKAGGTAAIIGSSFIGLEAASALCKQGMTVHIVSPEQVPFEGLFGEQVGRFVQALHESNGVRFHLGTVASHFDGNSLTLANGTRLSADIVIVGVGVRPRTAVARSAGLADIGGIAVDAYLETAVPGIFAAGDIAACPDPLTGEPQRIEHWVVAQRQGQVAAANMVGMRERYDAVPFFWSEMFGVSLRYVGHAADWDEVSIDGDVAGGDFIARYFEGGVHRASAAVGRDRELLEDERRMEARIAELRSRQPSEREPRAADAIQHAI